MDSKLLESENERLNALNENIRLESLKTFDKYCQIESENKKLRNRNLELKLENIAELKASKILFKMMREGHTHRQKNELANYANIVLETDIQSKIEDLQSAISFELPF